jgi:excinuclease ABC subunit A
VGGGTIVAATDPEGLCRVAASHTGAALRSVLARTQSDPAVIAGEGTNG